MRKRQSYAGAAAAVFLAALSLPLQAGEAGAGSPDVLDNAAVECKIGNTDWDLGTFPLLGEAPKRFAFNLLPGCSSNGYPKDSKFAEAAYCLLIEHSPYGRYISRNIPGHEHYESKMQVDFYAQNSGGKPIGAYGGATQTPPMTDWQRASAPGKGTVEIAMQGKIYGQIIPVKQGDLYPAGGAYSGNFLVNINSGAARISGKYDFGECTSWGSSSKQQRVSVKAFFKEACRIRAGGDINFGRQVDLDDPHFGDNGSVFVTCSPGQQFAVEIDDGLFWESRGKRRMKRDGGDENTDNDVIRYDLYQDSAHQKPWTSGPGGWLRDTGSGSERRYSVYAATSARQGKKNTGHYHDIVVVTVRSFAQ